MKRKCELSGIWIYNSLPKKMKLAVHQDFITPAGEYIENKKYLLHNSISNTFEQYMFRNWSTHVEILSELIHQQKIYVQDGN